MLKIYDGPLHGQCLWLRFQVSARLLHQACKQDCLESDRQLTPPHHEAPPFQVCQEHAQMKARQNRDGHNCHNLLKLFQDCSLSLPPAIRSCVLCQERSLRTSQTPQSCLFYMRQSLKQPLISLSHHIQHHFPYHYRSHTDSLFWQDAPLQEYLSALQQVSLPCAYVVCEPLVGPAPNHLWTYP